MDPILLDLSKRSCGPSVCGLYLGAFSHTDDIRTLSTNIFDCKLQMMLVSEYASSQGVALNVDKCEVSISSSLPVDSTHIHTADLQFPLTTSAKCLEALWSPNLSCTKWVEENIKKARRAFFARGSGVFHGTLNPLSSKSIVEHCVFPCLLFGAKTCPLYCKSWSPSKLSLPSASFAYQPAPLTTLPSWLCSGHL